MRDRDLGRLWLAAAAAACSRTYVGSQTQLLLLTRQIGRNLDFYFVFFPLLCRSEKLLALAAKAADWMEKRRKAD